MLAPCLSQLLIPSQADVLLYSPHQLIMSSALGMDYSYSMEYQPYQRQAGPQTVAFPPVPNT